MRKLNFLKLTAFLMVFFAFYAKAQQPVDASLQVQLVFDADSLAGFDEDVAKKGAAAAGCVGYEYKVYMSYQKRAYINAKYNIKPTQHQYGTYGKGNNPPKVQAAACDNEDFEASPAGQVTTTNGVQGWTIDRGTNNGGSTTCNLTGCCPNNPNAVEVYNAPAGYVDPVIGAGYPIYSVFGSGAQNAGTGINPQITQGCYGSRFIRINSTATGDYSMHRLTKTIAVTSANSLFRFAFIPVFHNAHGCCDGAGMVIRLKDGCGSNSVMACPQFSASAAGGCNSSNINFIPLSGGAYQYAKWHQATLDLTHKIGCNVTIEVVVADCIYSGHYAYMYFDAQCSPMDIIGNGNSFPAGTPKITLPTCGATGADIIAPTGLGPYLWFGPGSWSGNGSTSQTVTNVPGGTYTLTMNPPGACAPIIRTITVVNTASPSVVLTATQVGCTSTISAVSATVGGSAAQGGYTYTFTPAPGTHSSTGLQIGGVNFTPGPHTLQVTDTAGCKATGLFTISPAPTLPTVGISIFPTATINCVFPTVTLTANGGPASIKSNLTYSWTGNPCGNSTGSTVVTSNACTYTVFAYDPTSQCAATATFQVFKDVAAPNASVSPGSAILACGTAPQTFTGTPNGVGFTTQWLTPCGAPIAGYLNLPGCPGTHTFEVTNDANGCKSIYQVNVTTNNGLPTLTVTATSNHYTVNCVKCVTMQVQGLIEGGVGTAITSWQNSTMTSTLSTNPTYSTCVPGNYIVYAYNSAAPNCTVAQMVTVYEDKVAPTAGYFHNIDPFITQTPTVNCYNPCVTLTGTSTVSNYTVAWLPQGGGSVPDPTFQVCANTNTATTTLSTPSVQITNQINGCTTKVAVPVIQNIRTVGLKGAASPSVLTCNIQQAQLNFTPTPLNAQITSTWTTPPPSSTFPFNPISIYVPGTYTIEVTDVTNGCNSSTVVTLGLNNLPPGLSTVPDGTIQCGTNSAKIDAGITPTVGYTFFWGDAPQGATITPITGSSPSVTLPGEYEVEVTNVATGCKAWNHVNVVTGTLTADFTADPSEGFSPLAVNFTNLTNPTGGSTFWGYGNGSVQSSTTTINGSTTYLSPGIYTVVLVSTKGVCTATATGIVKVDIPSKLEVPNVFTPNGDGVNDFFILHTANLTDITASIYDRWGVKMYQTTTSTGNISWDGKNLAGQPVPAGTYFWIIKATGKDGQTYDEKGTVTVFVK